MRVVIYGAGAVGSVLGGRLAQTGADVVLVARPAHVQAIGAAGGLRIRTAVGVDTVDVAAVTSLATVTPGPDDVVIVTAKTQDTAAIHDALLAWNPAVAVVCGTNGVEHERMTLRRFERVYGMVIQMPAQFEKPGEVTPLCAPINALVDVGRYPSGIDDTARELAALLDASAQMMCEADPHIMIKKHAKLLNNLGNPADAACGMVGRGAEVVKVAVAEGMRVYAAAGIVYELATGPAEHYQARMAEMLRFAIPDGDTFLGGSTWQSLAKGATTLETDYLNGEILLLGRLHDIATPATRFLFDLADDMLRRRTPPGQMSVADLDASWRAVNSRDGDE